MCFCQLDSDARVDLCTKLKDIGFWTCLSHTSIESAYRCPVVPDRFVTIALMAENRHLLQLHDELADEVCVSKSCSACAMCFELRLAHPSLTVFTRSVPRSAMHPTHKCFAHVFLRTTERTRKLAAHCIGSPAYPPCLSLRTPILAPLAGYRGQGTPYCFIACGRQCNATV